MTGRRRGCSYLEYATGLICFLNRRWIQINADVLRAFVIRVHQSREPTDVSGSGMVSVLNRDCGYTRVFLTRHQDRILFATDAGWWSFNKPKEARELHIRATWTER